MASAAIFGINSNLDTGGIIDNLVALQRTPIDLIEAKRTIEDAKLLSFQDLRGRLQTFKSIVTTFNTETKFLATKSSFANTNATDTNSVVSLTTSSQASSGTFSLTIDNLARETKIVSGGFASTSGAVTQGDIVIIVGATSATITIDSTNDTADGLRLAINNSGLDVKATFLNDGSSTNPVRLVISGTQTGVDNSVSITSATVTFSLSQTAQNANFTLDGIAVTKSSNTVTDVITGTILTLESAGSGIITLTSDTDTIKENIQGYVDGFNVLMAHLNDVLSLDADTGQTSVLFANFTVQNLQQTLRAISSQEILGVSGDFSYLSQIGIRTLSDGSLSIDDGDLSDALAEDVTNLSELFSSKGSTTSSAVTFVGFTTKTVSGGYTIQVSNGVPQLATSGSSTFVDATGEGNFFAGADGTDAEGLNFRIGTLTDGSYGTITLTLGVAEITNRILFNLTDASLEGPLEAEIDTATATIAEYDETIIDLEERLVLFEEDLREKFTNLEILLGRLNSQRDVFEQSIDGIRSLFQKN